LAYQPDAVIISNPTALHLDVAIPAAQCGCHLLIEKPISHSTARVEELERVTKQYHNRVLIGYQFRFHPSLQQVKKLLNESAIGKPISAHAHWGEYLPDWHPWEAYQHSYAARPELGGGVVLTLSHPVDYLSWLLGEVESVSAFTSRVGLNLPVEDTAVITLRYVSGALGSVHLDYLQRPASHWLEIIGTLGSMHWDNTDGVVHLTRVDAQSNSLSQQEFYPPEGFERNWMFLDELRHFAEVVAGNSLPVCSLQDGIQSLRLCLTALASSQQASKP
jgi:predicted dehydrogenase